MTSPVFLDLSAIKQDVSVEAVSRYFGGRDYKLSEKSRERILSGIKDAVDRTAPQAIYQIFGISQILPDNAVQLDNGAELKLPLCLTDLESGTVAAVIGTLGSELEDYCRELAGRGAIYRSTLLDAVGTVLLDLLSEKICNILETIGKEDALLTGKRFAPGINGYPLEQQYLLFRLVDHGPIGVSLNTSAVMIPTKSISFFLVMTKTAPNLEARHKCCECQMLHCQFRLNVLQ